MKKIFTFFGLFLIAGMFAATAQTVPNSGFETWTNVNTASTWKSNNTSVFFLRQSTDKRSGTYAAEITSKANGSAGNLSGILTLGNVNTVTQAVTGGYPIASKPTEFHGYYKYTPGNTSDRMMVTVTMTKWTGSSRITLATANFSSVAGQTVSIYTMFSMPLTYNPTTIIPDSFNVIFKSSQTTAVIGSLLLVDDLGFTSTTDITENDAFKPSMWPNPANENVFFSLDGEKYNINVTNLIGQNVISTNTNEKLFNLNTVELPTGIYSVNLESKSNSYSLKLIISR